MHSQQLKYRGTAPHHSVETETEVVHLNFNLDNHDGYLSFIRMFRRTLAEHKDRWLHMLDYPKFLGNNPVLPKEESNQPARWMHIKLSVDDNKIHTTLNVRDDNLYLIGFMNQDGRRYEFSQKETCIPFHNESTFLGYRGSYGALRGVSGLMKLNLGQMAARKAVRALSLYGGEADEIGHLKEHLATLIVIFCECPRMWPYLLTVDMVWNTEIRLTDKTHLEYVTCWTKISTAMIGWAMKEDEYSMRLEPIGITDIVDARMVVYLIKNAPPMVKEAADNSSDHTDKPSPGGEDRNTEDRQPRKKCPNTRKHAASKSSKGKQHKSAANSGRQKRQQHSRPLMELIAMCATADISSVDSIAVFDGKRGQIIYKKEENRIAPRKDSGGNLVLTGPYTTISAGGRVALKITNLSGSKSTEKDLRIWDPYGKNTYYNELLSGAITSDLQLTYAVLSSAVEVSVRVDVFLFQRANFYGEITANSKLASEEDASIVLFSCVMEDKVELKPSRAGSTIPLARSVVAWPDGSPLEINVDKLRIASVAEGTSTSPSTRFKEKVFSFQDEMDKVCFTTLEGIGYARVVIDDTGEYREATKNSLPRSFRDMKNLGNPIETEFLIFTFEPNNLLPCLLHLTNKFDDQRVALRCCPGQESAPYYFNGISEFSVILPPESTSTYLVKLGTLLLLDMDALSLTLEICVALEQDEENEENVDKFFQISNIIEKVTLRATVWGPTDKIMACEIIPGTSLGSHHSVGVHLEEPMNTLPNNGNGIKLRRPRLKWRIRRVGGLQRASPTAVAAAAADPLPSSPAPQPQLLTWPSPAPSPSPAPAGWSAVWCLDDQQRRRLLQIHVRGVAWKPTSADPVVLRLDHGGEVESDGNCLFTAARLAAGTSAKATPRDLRLRAVLRFQAVYGAEAAEGEPDREAVDAAVKHLYAPDLTAGWGVHVVQEVKLLALKALREELDAAVQELVDIGIQREIAAETIYKERCIAVNDGDSWAKYMSISGSAEDEHDIITLQYTEEGLLTVDENRDGRAAAFGDDIAIECLATEFKREVFVVQAHGADAMVDEDNCVFFLPYRPRGEICDAPIFLFMKGTAWCGAGADHYEPLVATVLEDVTPDKAAVVL